MNDLYVDQDYRKSGVGRELMWGAKNFALKNNITKITLTTAKDNFKAQGLYESEGYKKDEDYFVYNLSC